MFSMLGALVLHQVGDAVDVVTPETSALMSPDSLSCLGGELIPSGRISQRKTYFVRPCFFNDLEVENTKKTLSAFNVEALFSRSAKPSGWQAWNASGSALNMADYRIPTKIAKVLGDEEIVILVRGANPIADKVQVQEGDWLNDLYGYDKDNFYNVPLGVGRNSYFQIKGKEIWCWWTIKQTYRDTSEISFFFNKDFLWPKLIPTKIGSEMTNGTGFVKLALVRHRTSSSGGFTDAAYFVKRDENHQWGYEAIPVPGPNNLRGKESVQESYTLPEGDSIKSYQTDIEAVSQTVPFTQWQGIQIRKWSCLDGYFGNVAMKPQHN